MTIASKGYRILKNKGPLAFIKIFLQFANRKVRDAPYYLGSGRVCPICGFTGRGFTPAGPRSRKDSRCPKCGSRERHRLLWLYIKNETNFTEADKDILCFAPKKLITKKLRESGSNVITADLSMDGVDVHLDITQLPFQNQTFDGIICSHLLEHIPDDRVAISEMHRVLAAGGDALILVPKAKSRENTYEDETITSPEAREEEFGTGYHVRLYGMDFPQRLSEAGFNVFVETYADELGDEATTKYGLRVYDEFLERELEDIHHCRKPDKTDS